MRRSRQQTGDDIPGLTAALTTCYLLLSVSVMMAWLVLNGWISILWACLLGLAVSVGLIVAQRPLYRALLTSRISRPGCLAGLYMYGASMILWLIIFWWSGLNAALFWIPVIPAFSFGIAAFFSSRAPRRGASATRRKR